MAGRRSTGIIQGDCIAGMQSLSEGTVNLAFADPPFNIGYKYDTYKDNRPPAEYLDWSAKWMTQVKRVLVPNGAFWLAIGDEYAAELKVLATRELDFHCRSWVVWYYTFGVHCESKFTRSHAHLFHFVRNPKDFVFNASEIRVPSARQLIYADKRANPKGRVPDDTWLMRPVPDSSWILRPQDVPEGFAADSDTWHIPRVCGTFKERKGFHGCQMPEQLLGRIIRACSMPGDLVMDPFTGSGTTLAVAKKLNRRYLGFELSANYAGEAQRRIESVHAGEALDGLNSPNSDSLQVTPKQRISPSVVPKVNKQVTRSIGRRLQGLSRVEESVIRAFRKIGGGFSTDRLIADPELNAAFLSQLQDEGTDGTGLDWNLTLLRLRKSNRLKGIRPLKPTRVDPSEIERCEIASEIALAQVRAHHEVTLDTILCSPELAQEFDQRASEICPDLDPLVYRWAALRMRKDSNDWRRWGEQARQQFLNLRFRRFQPMSQLNNSSPPDGPGLYAIRDGSDIRYVGDTSNLSHWAHVTVNHYDFSGLNPVSELQVSALPVDPAEVGLKELRARKGAKVIMVGRKKPSWNLTDLAI